MTRRNHQHLTSDVIAALRKGQTSSFELPTERPGHRAWIGVHARFPRGVRIADAEPNGFHVRRFAISDEWIACEGYPVIQDAVDFVGFDAATLDELDAKLDTLLPAGAMLRPDGVDSDYPF